MTNTGTYLTLAKSAYDVLMKHHDAFTDAANCHLCREYYSQFTYYSQRHTIEAIKEVGK